MAAEEGIKNGRRAGCYDIVFRPLCAFIKHYITKRGFLDGLEGFIISVLSSGYVLVKYAKLWNLARRNQVRDQ